MSTIFGQLVIQEKQYPFTFNTDDFILSIHDYCALDMLNKKSNNDCIKSNSVINGISSIGQYPYIKFIIMHPLGGSLNQMNIKIAYYIEANDEFEEFDSVSFKSNELNWFYNVSNAYTYEADEAGNISVTVKEYRDLEKSYKVDYDEKLERMDFNFERKIHNSDVKPLELNTLLTLYFKKSINYTDVYDYYKEIKMLVRYITYRKNIRFDYVSLKIKKNCKYREVGRLIVHHDKNNFYVEDEKHAKNRIIGIEYLDEAIVGLMKLIHEDRLYTRHIPENSYDYSIITIARFILTLAAFEWEVKAVYGDYKYKENKHFKAVSDDVVGMIKGLRCNYSNKEKKYLDSCLTALEYRTSLSERLLHVFKKNDCIIGDFIKRVYRINKVSNSMLEYKEISKRLEEQRNAFAHGNIAFEVSHLMALDCLVLEWLLYSMKLSSLGIDDSTCRKTINDLFDRRAF